MAQDDDRKVVHASQNGDGFVLVVDGIKAPNPRFVKKDGTLSSYCTDKDLARGTTGNVTAILRTNDLLDRYVAACA